MCITVRCLLYTHLYVSVRAMHGVPKCEVVNTFLIKIHNRFKSIHKIRSSKPVIMTSQVTLAFDCRLMDNINKQIFIEIRLSKWIEV